MFRFWHLLMEIGDPHAPQYRFRSYVFEHIIQSPQEQRPSLFKPMPPKNYEFLETLQKAFDFETQQLLQACCECFHICFQPKSSEFFVWDMKEFATAAARTISTTVVCIVQVGQCAISTVVVGFQLVGAPGRIRGCQDRCGGQSSHSNPPAFPPTAAASWTRPKMGSKLLDFPAIFVGQPTFHIDGYLSTYRETLPLRDLVHYKKKLTFRVN